MIARPEPARVSLPDQRSVLVTRSFNASRDRVYAAYTRPALLQRWLLGPPGWSMPVCEMDVRVGGTFRWRWRADDGGQEFGFSGTFLEVDPGRRLRHTEAFDPGDTGEHMGDGHADVTVTFVEHGAVTTVETLIVYASPEDRDAAMSTGMTDGMEISYQNLDDALQDGSVG